MSIDEIRRKEREGSEDVLANDYGSIRIVVLYSTVVHYVVATIRELRAARSDCEIDVVHWDRKNANSSRYVVRGLDGVRFYPRSSLTDEMILDLLRAHRPDIIWISGWVDSGYLRAVRRYRAEGGKVQVVCAIDDQWKGTLRQRLGQVYFRLFYRNLFDFMWVAGKPQYHYAQRFGYGHERIISNLLSADTARFDTKAPANRRFVFVGRFDPVKGLDLLLDAHLSLPEATQAQWPLVLIGDGGMREEIERRKTAHIVIEPFLQLDELVEELSAGGVACVPSYNESWGVVIHEMALMGYPLLLSSACGAATEFLINGYNGFLFRTGDSAALRLAMERICCLSDAELEAWSARSHELGKRISSEQSAQSLLSVLDLAKVK